MGINVRADTTEERPALSLPWSVFLLVAFLFLAHLQITLGSGRAGDYGLDLTLVLTAALGMIYGSDVGFWFGCAGGLFHDLAGSGAPVGLFALTGLVVGHVAGVASEWTVRSRWGVAGALIALLGLGQAVLVHVLLWIGGTATPWPTWRLVGAGLLWNGVLGALAYSVLGRTTGGRWY